MACDAVAASRPRPPITARPHSYLPLHPTVHLLYFGQAIQPLRAAEADRADQTRWDSSRLFGHGRRQELCNVSCCRTREGVLTSRPAGRFRPTGMWGEPPDIATRGDTNGDPKTRPDPDGGDSPRAAPRARKAAKAGEPGDGRTGEAAR